MEINEPSGPLIRWKLRLSEFDLDIQYKKEYANTQADALSCLATLGETALDTNDDIPCFAADAMDDASNLRRGRTIRTLLQSY